MLDIDYAFESPLTYHVLLLDLADLSLCVDSKLFRVLILARLDERPEIHRTRHISDLLRSKFRPVF